jgi:hypothetical protein
MGASATIPCTKWWIYKRTYQRIWWYGLQRYTILNTQNDLVNKTLTELYFTILHLIVRYQNRCSNKYANYKMIATALRPTPTSSDTNEMYRNTEDVKYQNLQIQYHKCTSRLRKKINDKFNFKTVANWVT